MNTDKKIAFIGGGNMAGSLIQGLCQSGYPAKNITVSDPVTEKVNTLRDKFGINGGSDNAKAARDADVILFAVKPQMMAEVLSGIAAEIPDFKDKLLISIMAGVTISRISGILHGAPRIVRVMPNTPALIGMGMAGLFASEGALPEDRDFARDVLASVGKAVFVKTEAGIDEITALSGSAPAYFFYFMECMAEKAKAYGYSEEDARIILEQVAKGSAEMVIRNQDKTLAELRAAVTSKGGTTYEAIKVMQERNLAEIISAALDACKNRAEEMGKQF
ncbi:pyrroline-5-carboxylate reductase [Succinimonas sp.]|uniref:pyrroline-5-carboxylate reductase n=1 Tax=Succinimonas sp. TaxID=1936151 RepID=UPI003866ABD3